MEKEVKKSSLISFAKTILLLQLIIMGALALLLIISVFVGFNDILIIFLFFGVFGLIGLIILGVIGFFVSIMIFIKNKKTKLGIKLLGASLIIICIFFLFYFSSSEIEFRKEAKYEKIAAEERYEILSERFKSPQKVISIHNLYILILDNKTSINLYLDGESTSTEKRREFETFANLNIVGKEVNIQLVEKEIFLRNYCCYGKGGSKDFVFAHVYFEEELINDRLR